jgi:hypothetical protein
VLGSLALVVLLVGPASPAVDGPPALERPRVRALEKYRTPTPHPRATSVPAALRAQLAQDPAKALKLLVAWLLRGIKDPFERVRVLHDWVALHLTYDWQAFITDEIPDQSIEALLTRRTAVCAGFASLFTALCEAAQLECVTIPGVARGFERALTPQTAKQENHAWNAVKIDGAWYLLDVTWDSPGPPGSPLAKQPFETTWFLLEPELMIVAHFPTDPAWQLLAEPFDFERFARQPWLSPRFLRLTGGSLEGVGATNVVDDELSFFVPHPDDVNVRALVRPRGDATDAELSRWAGLRREVGGTRITAAAPVAGECEVAVVLHAKGGDASAVVPMTARFAAQHGYASLSTEFVRLTGAPPAAQQWSNRVRGEFSITIPHVAGVGLVAQLEPQSAAEKAGPDFADVSAASQWVEVVGEPQRTTINVAFPRAGSYRVHLWAKRQGQRADSAPWSTFYLDVEEGLGHGYLSLDRNVLGLTGFPVGSPRLSNHVTGRRLVLQFDLPSGVEVSGVWAQGTKQGSAQASGRQLTFDFPEAGRFTVTVYANRRGQRPAPATSTLVFVE